MYRPTPEQSETMYDHCLAAYPGVYYDGYSASGIDCAKYVDFDHPSWPDYNHHAAITAALLTSH